MGEWVDGETDNATNESPQLDGRGEEERLEGEGGREYGQERSHNLPLSLWDKCEGFFGIGGGPDILCTAPAQAL